MIANHSSSPSVQVTRPDGKSETQGLTVVDEPTAKQSDPTVLDLQLRTLAKQPTTKPVVRTCPYLSIAYIYTSITISSVIHIHL